MLEFPRSLIVIPLDEVDCLAGDTLSVRSDLFLISKAEVSQKVENIIWLHAGIHTFNKRSIHFLRTGKRTFAVPDDVEVSEVKICCEPHVPHTVIFSSLRLFDGMVNKFIFSLPICQQNDLLISFR